MTELVEEIFSDGEWTVTLDVFSHGSVSNESGYAVPSDADDSRDASVEAIVRPSRSRKYVFLAQGRADSGEYLMVVRESAPVSTDDNVAYDGRRWNVESPEPDLLNGFVIYEMHEVVD